MTWAYDGQKVKFIYTRQYSPMCRGYLPVKVVICTVACAAGEAARVVNELEQIDIWVDLDELEPVSEIRCLTTANTTSTLMKER